MSNLCLSIVLVMKYSCIGIFFNLLFYFNKRTYYFYKHYVYYIIFISFKVVLKLYFNLILGAEQDMLSLSLQAYSERSLFILSVFSSNFILCCIRNHYLLAFCNSFVWHLPWKQHGFFPLVCLNTDDFCAEENTF